MTCGCPNSDRLTCPAHADLDVNLYGVRVARVVFCDGDVLADLEAQGGHWRSGGVKVDVAHAELAVTCGYLGDDPDDATIAAWAKVAARLDQWREARTRLRFAAAPGRLSLLWDPASRDFLWLPRSTPAVAT